jgi:hypothetical protein
VVVGHITDPQSLQVAAIIRHTPADTRCTNQNDSYAVSSLQSAQATAMPTVITIPAMWRGSAPALADLDGDGKKEVVAVLMDPTSTNLSLLVWNHTSTTTAPKPIPLLFGADQMRGSSPTSLLSPPLVYPLPNGNKEGLVIAGYDGGPLKYDLAMGFGFVSSFLSAGPHLTRTNAFAPTLFKGTAALPTLLGMTGVTAMSTIDLLTSDFGGTVLKRSPQPVDTNGFSPNALIHIAVGDITGDGSKTAVVADGEKIYLFPLNSSTAPSSFKLPTPLLPGAFSVLLANIDGKPGAEIIATNPNSNLIYAYDHQQQAVHGFPLTTPQNSTPYLHVLAEDLDRDGTIEIVALAGNVLRVYSLDPKGSYDTSSVPWPLPSRDLSSSATNLSEADPVH